MKFIKYFILFSHIALFSNLCAITKRKISQIQPAIGFVITRIDNRTDINVSIAYKKLGVSTKKILLPGLHDLHVPIMLDDTQFGFVIFVKPTSKIMMLRVLNKYQTDDDGNLHSKPRILLTTTIGQITLQQMLQAENIIQAWTKDTIIMPDESVYYAIELILEGNELEQSSMKITPRIIAE